MTIDSQAADLTRVLAWYADMGADAVIAETPIDWFARDEAVPGASVRSNIRALNALRPTGADSAEPAQTQPSRHDSTTQSKPVQSAAAAPARPPISNAGSIAASSPSPTPMGRGTPQPSAARQGFPTTPPDESTLLARTAAAKAKSLTELEAILANFNGCALKATAKELCFYRGAASARVMVIGEAPGRDDDLAGKPFAGRSGLLLDKMLAAIGLDESTVHITNLVYWRPPGNRAPTPLEVQICRPFLERQIQLVAPEFLIALGGAAAKALLGTTEGIMRLRGKWRDLDMPAASAQLPLRAMAILHPDYLLSTPAAKRMAWYDLLVVKNALDAGK